MENNKLILAEDKKQRVDNIFVNLLGTNEGKYRISSLCNKMPTVIKIDWDDETIKLESTVSLYECMLKVANEFDIDDIDINNENYIKKAYNEAKYNIMTHLSDQTKKSQTGIIKTHTVSLQEQFNEGFIEEGEEVDNYFSLWFNDIKSDILTKKQLDFLEDESIILKSNVSRIRRNIYKNTMRAYNNTFGSNNRHSFNREYELKIIEEILNSEYILAALRKHLEKNFISELFLKVSPKNRQLINKHKPTTESIKELREVLTKERDMILNEVM